MKLKFTSNSYNPFRKNMLCLYGFEFKKTEDYILIYRIVFDPETHFPFIKKCIRIDQNLHIQLQCDGNPISLPQWFIYGHNAKLTRFSMLENFPNNIQNVVKEYPYSILKELRKTTKRSPFIFCRANTLYSLVRLGNDCDDATEKQYFVLFTWGRFIIPSSQLAVCVCFAILDYADKFIERH